MFSKTVFVVAFAAVAQLVAAQPPACMLGAVNGYKTPSDIEAVCKDKDVTQQIAKLCGDGASDALSAFADVCNKAGVKVATDISTATSGSAKPSGTGNASANKTSYVVYTTASFDSSCSCTKTAAITSATVVGPTAITTGTGAQVAPSGSPTATGTGSPAQASGLAGRVDAAGAALLAGLGIFVAVL